MPTYRIEIARTALVEETYEVEADNADKAIEKVAAFDHTLKPVSSKEHGFVDDDDAILISVKEIDFEATIRLRTTRGSEMDEILRGKSL